MLDSVEKTISRYIMLVPGDRAGVAVSGGADSIALLHLLHQVALRWNLHLEVLHLDHQLRGAESTADAEFVRAAAARLNLPCHVHSVAAAALGGNLEESAREARHRFFHESAARLNLRRVATGHTRSDQAETVLFRLLRGAGPLGLAGILPVTEEGLIRPLIEVSREQVEEWLRQQGIGWREDSTNRDPAYSRNRIRHSLLPQLRREWNAHLDDALAQLADILRDEEGWWRTQIPKRRILSAETLRLLHPALARRFLRAACAASGVNPGFRAIESIRELAARPEGDGRLSLPGLDVMRSFDWIRIAPPHGAPGERYWTIPVTVPGRIESPAGAFQVSAAEPLPEALVLRNWRPGDHWGSKRMKTLFHEARIPLWERRDWPVLEGAGRILWTRRFGYVAPDNSFRIIDLDQLSDPANPGYNEAST